MGKNWKARDKKRNKQRYGMVVRGRSIFTIVGELIKKREQVLADRERKESATDTTGDDTALRDDIRDEPDS